MSRSAKARSQFGGIIMYKLTKKAEEKIIDILFGEDIRGYEGEKLGYVAAYAANLAIRNNRVKALEKREDEDTKKLEDMLKNRENHSIDDILDQVQYIALSREETTKAKFVELPEFESSYNFDKIARIYLAQILECHLDVSVESKFSFDEDTIYTIEEWEAN